MTVNLAAAEPAGGAALGQVVLATGSATIALAVLAWLVARHRAGRAPRFFTRTVAFSERVSGLPGWAALPSGVSALALQVALLGMYWDISLHIDDGRDPGPLANPAHYLILAGLFGVFSAGVLAMGMPREKPVASAIRVGYGWEVPVGGLLMAACGAFALAGFPLDDMWHRLFGQDVTLWGPTHLMLIGGAGMTLIGQAVLLQEGRRARRARRAERGVDRAERGVERAERGVERAERGVERERTRAGARARAWRQIAIMGGLLVGLSTFQAEFDFGVPQFRAVLQPALIALAAGIALVAARVWIGRGGAVAAALFFVVLRGAIALIVGPILGETTPSLPLYLGEALAIELAAVLLAHRGPLALGAAGGFLAGTLGFATEWGWTQVAMKLPWEPGMLPEGLLLAAVAGTAGGLLGALVGSALRGELPRPAVARPVAALGALALIAVLADGLYETTPPVVRAQVDVSGPRSGAQLDVRLDPPDVARDAAWLSATAWQDGKLVVNRLEETGAGRYRTTQPVPLDGDWKSFIRLQEGRHVLGIPVRMPADAAIPAPEVAPPGARERTFVGDRTLLQRERKQDVPGWLWGVASLVVLAISVTLLGTLAWGLGRVARSGEGGRPLPPGEPPHRAGDAPRFTRGAPVTG